MAHYELRPVYTGEDANVDIVFIHGLRGHITKTWTKNGVLWPQDLLPKSIPDCRVLLYGYDSSVVSQNPARMARTEIESDAADLYARLAAERDASGRAKPIIIVAHSLGGLVAAQAVVSGAAGVDGDASQSVFDQVRGMVFLGTPFRGSTVARPAEAIRNVLSWCGVGAQERTLKLLGVDSDKVRSLNEAFSKALRQRVHAKNPIQAVFFHETLPTKGVLVVNRVSALMPDAGECLPIQADHTDICKFVSEKDEGYEVVLSRIKAIIDLMDQAVEDGRETHTYFNYGKAANLIQGRGTQHIDNQNVTL
ncbi:hypothetical protein FSARC_342 [Fusarium sarcochroum]|uniref:AB hydrolase-1 domain-containing protein n=1 Tax=Fusarium sarcochroum TaxID=1208366 RepID=A0A8H4UBU7_9HYPO|nr:hypothetical protein FSARC_342 [Fusarium sarcochroum]